MKKLLFAASMIIASFSANAQSVIQDVTINNNTNCDVFLKVYGHYYGLCGYAFETTYISLIANGSVVVNSLNFPMYYMGFQLPPGSAMTSVQVFQGQPSCSPGSVTVTDPCVSNIQWQMLNTLDINCSSCQPNVPVQWTQTGTNTVTVNIN